MLYSYFTEKLLELKGVTIKNVDDAEGNTIRPAIKSQGTIREKHNKKR